MKDSLILLKSNISQYIKNYVNIQAQLKQNCVNNLYKVNLIQKHISHQHK